MESLPAGMAAAASNVGGLGLADAVLYAGSWRSSTKRQYETPWNEQTSSKKDLGITEPIDEKLYRYAFDPVMGTNPYIVLPLSIPNTASFEHNCFRVFLGDCFKPLCWTTAFRKKIRIFSCCELLPQQEKIRQFPFSMFS